MDGYRVRLDDIASLASQIPDAPLGPFGDLPVAYAVYKVTPDDEARKTERSYFIYANAEYCRLANCTLDEIIGFSHHEVVKSESENWATDSYRAAVLGETVNGLEYSVLAKDWVCFNMAPVGIENSFVCAFIPVNDQERWRQLSEDERTTEVISEMLGALAGEHAYEAAMNGMLKMAGAVIKPDRLIVFECRGDETEHTFEWCAEGVESQLGTVYGLPTHVLNSWFKSVVKDPVALVPNVAMVERFSPPLYEWCVENGVERFMAAPFFNEGNVVGFLGAYNYRMDGRVDINRMFGAVSSFIGARIENHRLIESLEWTGKHDDLTELLNRRGFNSEFAKFEKKSPGGSYVLALLDIDDFKSTNDRYGHAAGDSALKAIAQFMRESFPEGTLLCRTGGDEFLVVLLDKGEEEAEKLIEQFVTMDKEYEHDGVRRRITTSLGYACYPEQGTTRDELYSKADFALYDVKHSGKSGFAKFTCKED